MATSSTKPADSHPGFLKFLTRFHKKSTHIDLLRTLMYKTQKKSRSPELTRASTRGYKLRKSRPHPSDLCKYVLNFRKRTIPGDPPCSDLQNPKILATNDEPRAATRHQKVRWSPASFHALTRADSGLPLVSMMPHALTRAPTVLWCHDDIILRYFLTHLSRPTQFDPFTWPDLNRLHKKKKKRKRKGFDQVWTLT